MLNVEYIRFLTLLLSILFFILGFIRPVFMPLAYLACVFGKLPYYYPVLAAYQYEATIAVVGLIRTLFVRDAISKLNFKYNKYLLIFLSTVFVSFIVSWDHQYSWDVTLYPFIGVLLTYTMVLSSINNISDLKIFVWSFVSIYAFITYEPIYYYFIGEMSQEYFGEIVRGEIGILSGHRSLANNMIQIIPISYFLIFTVNNKIIKTISGIPLISFIFALILGKARIGVMGFAFFVALLIYYSDDRIKYGLFGGMLLGILFLFSDAFSGTVSRINIDNLIDSQIGLIHGIEMVRFGNILGVGPGCFDLARRFYFSWTLQAHSLYGEIIGELGIPGAIAWFFFIREVYRNLRKSINFFKPKAEDSKFLFNLSLGLLISLMVRLFVGLASHSLYIYHWYLVSALSIIMLVHLEIKEKQA